MGIEVRIRSVGAVTALALSALSAFVACSSSSGNDGDPPVEPDAGVPEDASLGADGGAETDSKPPCTPLTFDDSFATLDATKWRATGRSKDYPKVESVNGSDGGNDTMLALIEPFKKATTGAVWLTIPVPANAFDVSFDYLVACQAQGFCADGLAFVWADSTDSAALDNLGGGGSFGIPRQVVGGAASVSVAWDFAANQGWTRPSVAIHRVRSENSYSVGRRTAFVVNDAFVGTRHTVKLHLRNGNLSMFVDGAPTVEGLTIGGFTGTVGFTGATGDGVAALYVSSFHGDFYSCDPN